MKIVNIPQGSEEWLEFRKGKISGTRLGEVYSSRQYTKNDIMGVLEEEGVTYKKSAPVKELESLLNEESKALLASKAPKKIGFYEVLAERLAIDPDDENRMDRGLRLEEEALAMFTQQTGKIVERVGVCVSDVDERIINSPDGLIADTLDPAVIPKFTEATEVKCLASARHLQAVIENRVPDEYETQKIQYFVVNPELETLHFIFYDPRIASVPFHVVEVTRESLGDLPDIFLRYQVNQLKELDALVERLAF